VYGAKRIIESTATGPVVRARLNATGVAAVNAAARQADEPRRRLPLDLVEELEQQ